jgi:hypothetical protein
MSRGGDIPMSDKPKPIWSPASMKCALCPNVAVYAALFVPKNEAVSRHLGAPKGKTRMISYGLCERCAALPDRNARVETYIFREMGVN